MVAEVEAARHMLSRRPVGRLLARAGNAAQGAVGSPMARGSHHASILVGN
jgi:hypothetical protein